MVVIECLYQSSEMHNCGNENENVENLMRASPDIEVARLEAFWYSSLSSKQSVLS